MSSGDKKPDVHQSNHIVLKVKGQDENAVFFKIKKNAKLGTLMKGYCAKMRLELESLVFLHDGTTRIKAHNTPEELKMEDGDEIDVFLHQIGGVCFLA